MTDSSSPIPVPAPSRLTAEQLTEATLDQLRRDAKRLHRGTSMTHAEALDQVAQQKGFKNWSLLARSCTQAAAEIRPVLRPETPVPSGPALETDVPTRVRFEATRAETLVMSQIINRFLAIAGDLVQASKLELMMDLEACHCSGCPLNLEGLLGADRDADVVHDVAGISHHLNRETGVLGENFRPRYADNRPLLAA